MGAAGIPGIAGGIQANAAGAQPQSGQPKPAQPSPYTVQAGDSLQDYMKRTGAAGLDSSTVVSQIARRKYDAAQSTMLRDKQQDLAKTFRSDLGNFEGNTYNLAQQQGMGDLNRNLGLIKSGNSSRGLLYGGVNQGMEGQARGSMANALANQRAGINSQAEQAANALDQQAIQTGVGIQKNQQQIQNDIYARAMSDMNSENAVLGGLAQAAGTGAALYFSGGAAAPAVAGLAASQAGRK